MTASRPATTSLRAQKPGTAARGATPSFSPSVSTDDSSPPQSELNASMTTAASSMGANPSPEPRISTNKPSTNVWATRKEHIQNVQHPQSISQSSSSSSAGDGGRTLIPPGFAGQLPVRPLQASPSINGANKEEEYPPPMASSTSGVSAIDNEDSWPEVGKTGSSREKAPASGSGSGTPSTSKKGPKWVHAEELQAAFDEALQPPSNRRGAPRRPPPPAGASASASVSGPSPRASQAASRAGSVHSSPRLRPGNERKLPPRRTPNPTPGPGPYPPPFAHPQQHPQPMHPPYTYPHAHTPPPGYPPYQSYANGHQIVPPRHQQHLAVQQDRYHQRTPSASGAPPRVEDERPRAPGESAPVAGYRALDAGGEVGRMVFGSVGVPGASRVPSPAVLSPVGGLGEGETGRKLFARGEAMWRRGEDADRAEQGQGQWTFGTAGEDEGALRIQTGPGEAAPLSSLPRDVQELSGLTVSGSTSSDFLEVKDYGFGGRAGIHQPGSWQQPQAQPELPYGGARPFEREGFGPRRGGFDGRGGGYEGPGRGFGYRGRGRGLGRGYGGRGRGGRPPMSPIADAYYAPPPVMYPPPGAQMPFDMVYAPPPWQGMGMGMGYPYVQGGQGYAPEPGGGHASAHPPPPVPLPLSPLAFPVDPARYYLLGQLEYYLSAENMAQDLYLRRQMDSRGWIPIRVIANFNRVLALTPDPAIVRDVLGLSHIVELRDDWVRMAHDKWRGFVLPDAPKSVVEPELELEQPQAGGYGAELNGVTKAHVVSPDSSGEAEAEEEEEEDVVFVLGAQADGSWTPERHPRAAPLS